MRYALLLSILLFMLPTTLFAETLYVSEVREITLRTGPGAEYKITAMIKSGTPMTVMAQQEEWTQVQVANGKEGWVLTQFLQSKVPDAIVLEKLQKTHSALTEQTNTLKGENQDLNGRVTALTAELETCRQQYETLNTAHEQLTSDAAEFLTLQAKHVSTVKELAAQREKADQLENELSGLINDKRLTWFLVGAGVLVAGILLGFITKPQRRRSSLL